MDYYIEEANWEKILDFLKGIKGLHTKNENSLRRFIEAIWFVARGGCQWRLLPSYYGDWRAIHRRFKRWSDRGIWGDLMEYSHPNPDMEVLMIDATIVRAHSCASGYRKNSQDQEALGRSKGGFTTKIHTLVDALGNPLRFILSPGQKHDITQAQILTEDISDTILIADKAYDCDAFVDYLHAKGCSSVIPPKSNRKNPRGYDEYLYKERHLIECFFNKMKHYRRVFSRFDKSSGVFLGFLNFVGALIWLK
jgi:transposase